MERDDPGTREVQVSVLVGKPFGVQMTSLPLADLRNAEGRDLGCSEWIAVDQDTINLFAEATGDHNWVHVDAQRAADGPYGTTIAHGYLLLSLLARLLPQVLRISDRRFGLNYGIDHLRFTSPVLSGSRIRLHATVGSVEVRQERTLYRLAVSLEVEATEKPAMVAQLVFLAA